jgi:nucleolin
VQSSISTSTFRRFASDEAKPESERDVESADKDDRSSIRSAIDSATESVSTYASDAAESLTHNAEAAKDSILGTASSTGFAPRNPLPAKGGYGNDASGRAERVLTPTSGIYVGNLLFDITASDLQKEFEPFGTVKSTIIATDARGLSKG